MEHLRVSDELVFSTGALPRKVKLLMALAFDAAGGAAAGVRWLAQEAMKEGATKEEIAETVRVACQMAGEGCAYVAAAGLKDLV
jgi:alkylhydroperoxidase/carboxymuconolactone decarboxylase family protein YurZ